MEPNKMISGAEVPIGQVADECVLLWLLSSPTGAMSLAAALAAGGGSLRSLDMSGCELTDTAAAALAGLLAAVPAAEAPAAAVSAFRSPLKWRSAAAAVPAEERVQLQELRLVDNQITSAGGLLWQR
jgi:hypothetical protein